MTVEADIFNTLKALVANRVFPDLAPLNTPRPFITYSQVGGEALAFLSGPLPDKKNGRFQIDVYADSRAACAAVALQVESAMAAAAAFQCTAIGAPVSTYEPDVLIFGSQQDFSIWSTR
jgi:hypothetical protein